MTFYTINPPEHPDAQQEALKREIEDIRRFQSELDEMSKLDAYTPAESSIIGMDDWITPQTEVLLSRRVAVPVTDIPTARQYLWDCCVWATVLNTDRNGLKIGTLPDGRELFCSRYLRD